MHWSWTDEQREHYKRIADFASRELNNDIEARDASHGFSRDDWNRCAGFGLAGLPVPAKYGGSGCSPVDLAVALQALGYGCRDNGLIFALNAHMWSAEIPILNFGSPAQKQRWLPPLCDGSVIAVGAMTEPEAGSDAFSMTTTATSNGDEFILNGTKTYITNAPVADLFVLFAATDKAKGFAGISAFLVEKESSGIRVGKAFKKMGLRTTEMAQIEIVDCRVPATNLLGSLGSGMSIFTNAMDWERSFILASAVGTMQRQLEQCLAHAKTRKQFGQAIGKFQAVSHRLVDMRLRLHTCRLMVQDIASRWEEGKASGDDASLTKLYLSECFVQSSLDALYLHGASGYMADMEFERDVRDAIAARIYSGTSDIQRNVVAGWMRL